MKHSAVDLQQACMRPEVCAEGIQLWYSLLLPVSSNPQSLIVRSQLGLQECALEWLGGRRATIRSIDLQIYMSWVVASDFVRWLQDCIPPLCANFRDLGLHFDKISSRSSFESDGGVIQESEKMLYSVHDWNFLGLSYSSESINHYRRSLVLKYTIIPN